MKMVIIPINPNSRGVNNLARIIPTKKKYSVGQNCQ